MSSTKLKNAPLQEVIFELRWEGERNANGLYDNGFDLAHGRLYDKLKAKFPLRKKTMPDGMPVMVFGVPQFQYWKGEFEWPLVQHGQGMLAINEIENGYEWEKTYRPMVVEVIGLLCEAYDESLKFNMVQLKYVDAWDVNTNYSTPQEFINSNFRARVHNEYDLPGKLNGINLLQSFLLDDASEMQVTVANGVNNQTEGAAVVLDTTIKKEKDFFTKDEIIEWLDSAHAATSKIFKQILTPDFYGSLDQ